MPNGTLAGAGAGVRHASSVRASGAPPAERCELCSAGLAHEHPHLVELASRQIVCACDACATALRRNGGREITSASPARAQLLTDFRDDRRAMGESADSHQHGVLLPFQPGESSGHALSQPGRRGRVAASARCVERDREEESLALAQLQPDIEALLVNRVGHAHGSSRAEYYIAPIDECYRLVGLIRMPTGKGSPEARGLGGDRAFFSELRSQGAKWSVRKPMPDLSFKIEEAQRRSIRGRADACVQASHQERNRRSDHPHRRAALPDSD